MDYWNIIVFGMLMGRSRVLFLLKKDLDNILDIEIVFVVDVGTKKT